MKNPREFPTNWDLRAQKNYRLGHDAIFLFACKKKINRLEWMIFSLILAEFDLTRFARCPVFFLFFFGYTTWFKRQRAEPWILEFRRDSPRRVCFGDSVSSSTGFLHMCAGGPRWWNLCCAIAPWILWQEYGRECKLKGVRFQRSTVMSRFSFLLPNMYRATQTVLSMQKEKILKQTTIRHIW